MNITGFSSHPFWSYKKTVDLPEENLDSHLEPTEKIDRKELSGFFVTELKKIKSQLE